jgi:hypothetical protein
MRRWHGWHPQDVDGGRPGPDLHFSFNLQLEGARTLAP